MQPGPAADAACPSCGCLDRVDLVLVGAEAVVENGGVINKLGTYQARGYNK